LFCCGQVTASLEEFVSGLFLKLRNGRKEILLERCEDSTDKLNTYRVKREGDRATTYDLASGSKLVEL
jgi:hypothetical protein